MEMPRLLKKVGFYFLARWFVAGEDIEDAIRVAHELKKKGVYAIINILGEDVKDPVKAAEFCGQYIKLLIRLREEDLDDVHIAVKPSQLGLDSSERLFEALLADIFEAAKLFLPNSLVEIDGETKHQAKIAKRICWNLVKEKGYQNVRICHQANYEGIFEEVEKFTELAISDRLCKGAYSGDIKDPKEIKKIISQLANFLLEKGRRPTVATHDLSLIEQLDEKIGKQVLLGIENNIMIKLAQRGHEVGFYVPCGPYWYPYGKRRWKSILKIFWRNFWYQMAKSFNRYYQYYQPDF
jgi:proline dehydrogenase